LAAQLITLYSFNGSDGGASEGALIADANGDLFGTTGAGALYEIRNTGTVAAPSYASAPTTLLSFNDSTGWSPSPGLSSDAHGDLFGGSNGGVFEIKNTGTVAAPIYTSPPTTVASLGASPSPEGGFTFDASGDLFGTTYNGGVGSYGTVFEIKNIGTAAPVYASTATTLFSFSGWNGSSPPGGLVIDANGNLFGTTSTGGANNTGTVFELQNTGTIGAPVYASPATTLVNFGTVAPLTIDARGDVFGVTSYGPYGGGAVFEIKNNGAAATPSYSGATTLANLAGSDGSGFYAALILDAQGDLFGTSDYGGSAGVGNVFEIKNNGTAAAPLYASTATTLFSFDGSNGRTPQAGLTADSSGHLLGTTFGGGANGDGTVFEITGVVAPPPPSSSVSPTLTGVHSTQTTAYGPVKPFAGVTIHDSNPGATESVSVTISGAGGTLTAGGGSTGYLRINPDGSYTLCNTVSYDPATITAELDALVFTPSGSGTTTFEINDASYTYNPASSSYSLNGDVDDHNTSVIEPPMFSPNAPHANDLARSGDVTGAHDFIDMPNFVASYGDLINAFGTNQPAAQNWYNTREPIENRVETFDGLDYVASYGDLINAFKSAGSQRAVLDAGATHFINNGHNEGRTTTFNGLDYIASYGDLIHAFGANGDAGAYHYIDYGSKEGRTTTFDGLDYIASYGDLIKALGANEQAGAEHFIDNGYKEGRTTTFDGLDYIANYTDLMTAFGANNDAGATHYINNGFSEHRSTSFNVGAYESAHPDLIGKFSSNDAFLTAYINTYKTTGAFLT
jgi:uncharacterized repeat protein (TIGR03803 family)